MSSYASSVSCFRTDQASSLGRSTAGACRITKKWYVLYLHSARVRTDGLGIVYEKRLIESYISENRTEPATGEDLNVDDLIELRTSRIVRPRPPTLTSIPSLLGVFQEEWDALALETYTLKQNLAQTRQELSTALYQHDAAVRVIARLTRERDEAREALSKVRVR